MTRCTFAFVAVFAFVLAACSGTAPVSTEPGPDRGDAHTSAMDAALGDGSAALDGTVGTPVSGSGVYGDAEIPPVTVGCGASCEPVPSGCLSAETCGNGLDDDCNGAVDEHCPCVPGTVQRCFAGPPGGVRPDGTARGACAFGMQTCAGSGEFGTWDDCAGGIGPRAEVCDGLDDNCNGCEEEGLCCNSDERCPGPGDPRIPQARPFNSYTLRGDDFVSGVDRVTWHVVGGPCDRMLYATSRSVSFTLNGRNDTLDVESRDLVFAPTLSGDYVVTMSAFHGVDPALSCTFVIPVRASGLRVELCWDTSGSDDVDLWLARAEPAFVPSALPASDTCDYIDCAQARAFENRPSWGYAPSPANACSMPLPEGCPNPRLDIDNVSRVGIPENISVDAPDDGAQFRVFANYFGTGNATRHEVHPMLNVYCGGVLRATYGGATVGGQLYGPLPVTGFNTPGGNTSGSLWRIADVTTHADGTCTLAPLHPQGRHSNDCVASDGSRTFDGPCAGGR